MLLAKTFGDLIQPLEESDRCPRTSRLPQGQDLLAVPLYMWQLMPDAERYTLREDDIDHSCGFIQITDYIFWHSFDPFPKQCQCNTVARCQFLSNLGRKVTQKPRGNSKSPRVNLFKKYPSPIAVIGGSNTPKKNRKPSSMTPACEDMTATDDGDSVYHSFSDPDSTGRPSIGEGSTTDLNATAEDDHDEINPSVDDIVREACREQAFPIFAQHNLAERSTSLVPGAKSVRSRLKTWSRRWGAHRTLQLD